MVATLVRLFMFTYMACWLLIDTVVAAQQMPLIRDSEIEHIIRRWGDPLFDLASLDRKAVTIRLVNSSTLNAFVTGGQNIFLHSGLLVASTGPNQIIGVIAHEIGHLTGRHMARTDEAIRNARNVTLMHTLLGIGILAVGSATGSTHASKATGALVLGGGAAGVRHFLSHTRTQERAADQFALTLLDRNKISARGLLKFLKKFEEQELLSDFRQDPYLRTHPLTRERLTTIKYHVDTSPWSAMPIADIDLEGHARLKAKLIGFLQTPEYTFQHYPDDDRSVAARYARTIAYHRALKINASIGEIDGLIHEYPKDAYFKELKGQILFENGRLAEAWPYYDAANSILPNDPVLMLELARLGIELEKQPFLAKSITALEHVVRVEPDNNVAWWLLSIGYGRVDRLAESALASGEQALLEGRSNDAALHAERAGRIVPEGSPSWLRAQDLREVARRRQSATDH